jgi:hypothetical protein
MRNGEKNGLRQTGQTTFFFTPFHFFLLTAPSLRYQGMSTMPGPSPWAKKMNNRTACMLIHAGLAGGFV